ncbi:ribosome production factor 2 homolog [Olea europaea subsp. europaea]|uniref:Ribosome production factor 2 homolog n=1 Tax=Olea europaea subsp. europaea TaxID=158383 RepID=A0A8S0RVS2_OLEEU|nr:ribosome production factor 2 homolog [Olea europaea subsp. europaea]
MMKIKTPKNGRIKREIEKRVPKLVETGKKTLILHGTKTSSVLNSVLTEIYHLKKENAIKYSRRNVDIRPFESGGETSLEFFSLKTDCSLFVFGSHSKKRPNNLVIGRAFDHHIYDLVEIGVENYNSMNSFSYDKKLAPQIGSKPFFAFVGEGFESVEELKHLKEILLDLFHGEVVTNLNLAGLDRVYVCTATSSKKVLFTHCALRLKKSGTIVPRMELVEFGPSMDMVVRRHRLPDDSLRKEAMKIAPESTKKKVCRVIICFLQFKMTMLILALDFQEKNVTKDAIQGKIGKIYIPDQKVGSVALPHKAKGVKRERREAKMKDEANGPREKKHKHPSE